MGRVRPELRDRHLHEHDANRVGVEAVGRGELPSHARHCRHEMRGMIAERQMARARAGETSKEKRGCKEERGG
eukprot:2714410-Rhodomonas_salina.1